MFPIYSTVDPLNGEFKKMKIINVFSQKMILLEPIH